MCACLFVLLFTLIAMESVLSAELKTKLEELEKTKPTSNDGKNIVAPFLDVFKNFLTTLEMKFESFKKDMIELGKRKDEHMATLQQELIGKTKIISKLDAKMDEQDQYVRREALIFSGNAIPVWVQNENCVAVICNLITAKFGNEVLVDQNDISVAHRLGPKPNTSVDRRSIIVRFCRRNLKYQVLNLARRKKLNNLFVSESLTSVRQAITFAIRKAKREFPDKVSGHTTIDGSIKVWVKPPNPDAPGARNLLTTVNTMDYLETFCQRNFDLPASHFLPSDGARNRNATE